MNYRVHPRDNEGGVGDWLVSLLGHVFELGIVLVLVLVLLLVVVRSMGGQ